MSCTATGTVRALRAREHDVQRLGALKAAGMGLRCGSSGRLPVANSCPDPRGGVIA